MSLMIVYCFVQDENQRVVVSLFPLAFQYIQRSIQPALVKSVVSFLGLAVANNGKYEMSKYRAHIVAIKFP